MINYQGFQALFQMLKVKRCVKKIQFNTFGWGMVKIMHIVLLETTKATFVAIIFIAISANEVMMIDNTQCISIHLYQRFGKKDHQYGLQQQQCFPKQ
jgi:hypothetical protein